MRPVAIFRHAAGDGPGYFSTYLAQHNLPSTLIRIDRGEKVPTQARHFSGIGLMGGPMSVNDPLPWIPPLIALLQDAVADGVPVIGHCLGGQLLSKALGGEVGLNPVKEIGWREVAIADTPPAREWFGETRDFLSFHWHGDTFSIPPGAERIAWSEFCANQAFVYRVHLGLQCHVEMTPEMVADWCRSGTEELRTARSPAVQSAQLMQQDLQSRVAALNAVAARLYDRWVHGVRRDD